MQIYQYAKSLIKKRRSSSSPKTAPSPIKSPNAKNSSMLANPQEWITMPSGTQFMVTTPDSIYGSVLYTLRAEAWSPSAYQKTFSLGMHGLKVWDIHPPSRKRY